MSTPHVSIIIPTYNRLPIVFRAIDSVLIQSYKNIECLVIDDSSTDDTFESLSNKYKSKITLIQNDKNMEKSFTRNKGIKLAKGDYICFLDSDDELTIDSVEKRMNVFLNNSNFEGVSFGLRQNNHKKINKKETPLASSNINPLELDTYIDNPLLLSTNSFLISKKNMLEFGMYNEKITNKEDIELFLRLLIALPFNYCESVVTTIHCDAQNRARNNFDLCLEQDYNFINAIKGNSSLINSLGKARFSWLIKQEHNEKLRMLYHSNRGEKYRETYRKGWDNHQSNRAFKFIKRYLLSYFK